MTSSRSGSAGTLRRALPLIAVAVFVTAVSFTGGQAHAASAPPSFGRPVSVLNGWGFEPNLRVDTHGRMYMSVPNTASSGYSFIWRSLDGGATWKWVPAATPYAGKISTTCAGGGDTELATDSNDNLYFNDLYLVNFSTARSGDQGTTFAPATCAAVDSSPDDRQWYAVEGDPTNGGNLVLAYNIAYSLANPGAAGCTPSNQLVVQRSPIVGDVTGQSAGVQFSSYQGVTSVTDTSCPEGIMGADELHTYGGTTQVFVPHDNAALTAISVGRCDLVTYTTSPTGFANCVDLPVASFPNDITGGNFPVLTIDRAGNIYVVWEEAAYDHTHFAVTGDCILQMAVSHDQGASWTVSQIPTPGLYNNVFAWAAAGDDGRVDLAWYGTASVQAAGATGGPTSAEGDWSLYFAQTLDGATTWTAPINAGEHFVHRGHIFTLLGLSDPNNPLGPSLDTQRTATGDFLQLRIGLQGEAVISYTDSNHPFEGLGETAFVRQNGGSSVFADPLHAVVAGSPAASDSIADPAGDATLDAAGQTQGSFSSLDVRAASAQLAPDGQHYRLTMTVGDLTSLSPPPTAGGTDLVWQISWLRPERRDAGGGGDANGGHHFFAYMESNNGAAPVCFEGDAAFDTAGNGALRSYPGLNQISGAACSYTPTAPGTITIDVPIVDVSPTIPIDSTLYSVTAATMTLSQPANTVQSVSGIGGTPFNLIDAAAPFDFNPSNSAVTPEGAPLLIALSATGAAAVALAARRARRRRSGAPV